MHSSSIPLLLAATLVLPAGCGKKDESRSGDEPSRESAPAQSSAEPAKQSLEQALGGAAKPALFGPFAKARFGMTEDELKAASPVFAAAGDYLSPRDYGVGYFVGFDGEPKRFTQLRVTVPAADVALLEQRWGTPTEITYRRDPAKVWLDPEARIRVVAVPGDDAGEQTLIVASYLPVTAILGEPGQPLGIETAGPLLGASPADLQAAYPDNFRRNLETLAFMEWPPDDCGDAFQMELRQDDGKTSSLQFWIHHGDNEAVKAAMLGALEAKYGAAKETKSALGRKQLELSASPAVVVGETTGAWVVEVSEKK